MINFCLLFYKLSAKIKKYILDFGSKLKSNYLLTFHLTSIVTSFIRRDKLKYRGLRGKETGRIIIIIFSDPSAIVSCPYFCPPRVHFMQVKLTDSIVFLDKYIATTVVVIVIFTTSRFILIGNTTLDRLDVFLMIFRLMVS